MHFVYVYFRLVRSKENLIMPRQNRSTAMEGLLPGKIRKRGCSSSASSSSSVVQNYRFKRAILVGKRGGSTTPVPTWKLMGTGRTPSSALRAMDSPKYAASQNGSVLGSKGKQQQAPVSARKLAATLWEMNEMPSPRRKDAVGSEERRLRKEARARERAAARSVHSGSLPPHLSDPSHSPVSEVGFCLFWGFCVLMFCFIGSFKRNKEILSILCNQVFALD